MQIIELAKKAAGFTVLAFTVSATAYHNLAIFHYNRGVDYAEKQEWDLALAEYSKAIALNPNYANAYINRGIVYRNQQKWDLALADYNQAIRLNPNDADAYLNRGNVYDEQEKWDLAMADYTEAIKLNPNDAKAYYNRGNFYYWSTMGIIQLTNSHFNALVNRHRGSIK